MQHGDYIIMPTRPAGSRPAPKGNQGGHFLIQLAFSIDQSARGLVMFFSELEFLGLRGAVPYMALAHPVFHRLALGSCTRPEVQGHCRDLLNAFGCRKVRSDEGGGKPNKLLG